MPAYHAVPLDPHELPDSPSVVLLSSGSPLNWAPTRDAMVAQDSLIQGGRRPIFAFGLKGAATWPWDATDSVGSWPDRDDWRRVWGPIDVHLTPGNFLRMKILYLPNGVTQYFDEEFDAPGPPSGAVRVGVSWANPDSGASDTLAYHEANLEDGGLAGELPTAAGTLWPQVYETEIIDIQPPGIPAVSDLADYSEGTVATIRVEVQGGARILDAVLYEYPAPNHVQRHDDTFPVSVHGAHEGGAPPATPRTQGPQEARHAVGLFDERRYGTLQTLRTAHQQAEYLGPHIMTWTPWVSDEDHYEHPNSFGQDEVEPRLITGTTNLVSLFSGSSSSWRSTGPGWLCHASHAQLHRYCDPNQIMRGGARAVVPVRVTVRGRWSGAGTGGIVRVQSSETEWVDVTFDSSGTTETISTVGWLESQAAADQARGNIQIFGRITDNAHTLRVYGVSVEWGWKA